MLEIKMSLLQTVGFSVIFLLIGMYLRKKVSFFLKYSIPAAVIGGVLFSIIHLILRSAGIMEITFDTALQGFFQAMYFCTIGLDASFRLLKKGGSLVFKFLFIAIGMSLAQNIIAVGISNVMGFEPLLGLLMGSSALVGGTGTSAAVAPSVEALGYSSALTVALTAATFGIVSGSISGGPIARRLIEKKNLYKAGDKDPIEVLEVDDENADYRLSSDKISLSLFMILVIMFFGSYLTEIINNFVGIFIDNVAFPGYLGTMLIACFVRNYADSSPKFNIHMEEVGVVAKFSLQLFLGIALLNLKLWLLLDIALPMAVILIAQLVFAYIYATYLCFPIMGKNYDAAMMSSGLIGFGMGSTSNAMANMNTLSETYRYSSTAFFVVPIVGALFIDFFNIFIIYGFIGFLAG